MTSFRAAMDEVANKAPFASALHRQFCKRLLNLDPEETAILSNGRVRLPKMTGGYRIARNSSMVQILATLADDSYTAKT